MSNGLTVKATGDTRPPAATANGSESIPVLFINSPPSIASDSRIHVHLMRELPRPAFDVHVACFAGEPRKPTKAFAELSTIADLHLRNTNFGPSVSASSFMAKVASPVAMLPAAISLAGLATYVKEHGIQVIHATTRPRDAIPCVVLGKVTGAKSLIHLHVKNEKWISKPVRWAMQQADALVAISDFVARSLIVDGYDKRKIHTVLNGVDLTSWDYTIDQAAARGKLSLDLGSPVIVCVSRLFHWKGQADLLRALSIVQRSVPDVMLLIVGADDLASNAGQGSYSSELTALTRSLGLEANVKFLGQRDDVAELMAASDLFALPSFEEPFGLVFLEAMAMKRPVVALNNGGTPEVVTQGKTGLLSEPTDIEALAENILNLIHNPGLRRQMAEQGRIDVEQRFTTQRMSGDMAEVYERITAKR